MYNGISACGASSATIFIEESDILFQQKLKKIEANLQKWVDTVPYGREENRDEAKCKILEVYKQKSDELKLLGLNLTSLPEAVFSELEVKVIDLSFNKLTMVSAAVFSGVKNLEILVLSFNLLRDLSENTFSALPCLEKLDLSCNKLSAVSETAFSELPKLLMLDLSYNQIKSLSENLFSNFKRLGVLLLNDNRLRELSPALFSTATDLQALNTLDLNNNRLKTLHPNTFKGLINLHTLDIRTNQLETLFDSTFAGLSHLEILILSENQLRTLPNNVFSELTKLKNLSLGFNKLESLSAELFSKLGNLQQLNLTSNGFRQLEGHVFDQLSRLQILNLSSNVLSVLPEEIFKELSNLQSVYLGENRLSILSPQLLPRSIHLRNFGLENNRLTDVPNNIIDLPHECQVILERNSLSSESLENLHRWIQVPHYRGPQIHFSMAEETPLLVNTPLEQVVQSWFKKVSLPFSSEMEEVWKNIGDEVSAQSFAQFLEKLMVDNVNSISDSFQEEIVNWLGRLSSKESKGLRELVFPIAMQGLGSCEDRVSLTLNAMRKAEVTFEVECKKYDENIKDLILLARQQFRADALEQISAIKVKTLNFVDEVEVYLAYVVQLRDKLDLHIGAEKMRFFAVAGVTPDDLNVAELQVKRDENKNFKNYFSNWAPWQNLLKRRAPADYEKLQADVYKAQEKYYAEKQNTSDGEPEAKRLKVEHEVMRSLESLKDECYVKATETFLKKVQPELLIDLSQAVWSI